MSGSRGSPGGMRIAFNTLGCRLNQFEGDAMRQAAIAAGHEAVAFDQAADVYVINTCTVTTAADADSRRLVRQAARRNPQARVIVTGCYAQVSPAEVAALPGVGLVLGNAEKAHLVTFLNDPGQPGTPRVVVGAIDRARDVARLPAAHETDRTRAYLKIQDGCNYQCAFCIVPTARGRNRSVPVGEVLAQASALWEAGYREVTLTGVHLGTYGRDLTPRVSLAGLAAAVVAGARGRVRLSSIDPHEVADELLALLAEDRRLCRHLHLPVQSGDETVLRRMRRRHTAEDFRRLVGRAAEAVPGIGIGADVIVGFPGETEEAFGNTGAMIAALPISYLHVFTYSRRPGTAAATMLDQVPAETKACRSRALRGLAQRKGIAFRRALVGRTVEVVVLGRRHRETGLLEGITDSYVRVLFPGDDGRMGTLAQVRVEEVVPRGTVGQLV